MNKEIKQTITERLSQLTEPELIQVLDFIDSIIDQSTSLDDEGDEPNETINDLFANLGLEMDSGEMEEILTYIDEDSSGEAEKPAWIQSVEKWT